MPDNKNSTTQATRLHHTIRTAVRAERASIHTIAHDLAEMRQTQLYKELGYAGIYEYAEAEFGYAPSKTQQLSRAGVQLKELPRLDRALKEGGLGWTKVRTLARVATPETEEEWIRLAAEKSSRELEELASSSLPGDTPPEEKDEDIEELEYAWATIRFEKHHYVTRRNAASDGSPHEFLRVSRRNAASDGSPREFLRVSRRNAASDGSPHEFLRVSRRNAASDGSPHEFLRVSRRNAASDGSAREFLRVPGHGRQSLDPPPRITTMSRNSPSSPVGDLFVASEPQRCKHPLAETAAARARASTRRLSATLG